MTEEDVKRRISSVFNDAKIQIIDTTGTGDHFSAVIISDKFDGKSLVQRHQMVYGSVSDVLTGELHALQLKTLLLKNGKNDNNEKLGSFIWQKLHAEQQPQWKDESLYNEVVNEISQYPPLVFAGEVKIKKHLADAAQGNGFLIQGGDCAETFNDFKANSIRDKLKILLQMSVVLTYGASCNVVKVGRIAGQFAKPRSSKNEIRNNLELPTYRGDAVNDIEFNETSRTANPKRLLKVYNQSAATLNLLRAFTLGGFADLNKVHLWNQEFITNSVSGEKYKKIASSIDYALKFMNAVGITSDNHSHLRMADLYTSHEALLLGYEQALTRQDSISGIGMIALLTFYGLVIEHVK